MILTMANSNPLLSIWVSVIVQSFVIPVLANSNHIIDQKSILSENNESHIKSSNCFENTDQTIGNTKQSEICEKT